MKGGEGARDELVDRIEDALVRWSGGFRPIDRGLRLDGERVADLAGFLDGRPCLVLALREAGGDALERVLAALACAAHAGALAVHLAELAGDGELEGDADGELALELEGLTEPARVLVVTDGACERELRDRLRLVARPELWLFELHRIESRRGASGFVARIEPEAATGSLPSIEPGHGAPPRSATASRAHGLERLLRSLPAEEAALARDLAARLDRLDPLIACTADAHGLRWSCGNALLCRLAARGGRLEGKLAEHELPHRIHSADAAEVFVDLVLALHLDGLDADTEGAAASDEQEAPAQVVEEERRVPVRAFDPMRPILTREEIEAFRD